MWIWIVAVPSLCAILMACALGPAPGIAGFERDAKDYLYLIGIALLLGICVAALTGPFILGPLYHYREELNGYPFQPDDAVELLVGANRGRVARVVEVLEGRGVVRVDLGEFATPGAKTLFRIAQVIKVTKMGPAPIDLE